MNLSIYGGSLSEAQAASRFRSGPRVHRCAMGKAKARAAPLGMTNGKTLSVSEIHLSRRTCDALAARRAFAISFRGGSSESCAEPESESAGAGVDASGFFLVPEVSAGFTDLIFTRETRR